FTGTYQIPIDSANGTVGLKVRAVDELGREVDLPQVQFTVDSSLPYASKPPSPAIPQPTVAEVVKENLDLPIAAQGRTWVLFDLRGFGEERLLSQEDRVALAAASAVKPLALGDAVIGADGFPHQVQAGELIWAPSGDLTAIEPDGRRVRY